MKFPNKRQISLTTIIVSVTTIIVYISLRNRKTLFDPFIGFMEIKVPDVPEVGIN